MTNILVMTVDPPPETAEGLFNAIDAFSVLNSTKKGPNTLYITSDTWKRLVFWAYGDKPDNGVSDREYDLMDQITTAVDRKQKPFILCGMQVIHDCFQFALVLRKPG